MKSAQIDRSIIKSTKVASCSCCPEFTGMVGYVITGMKKCYVWILAVVCVLVLASSRVTADSENLATAAYATASSEFVQLGYSWSPEMAVDRDPNTRWNSAQSDNDPWIALHWAFPKEVQFIRILPLSNSISNVDVETSGDGITWYKLNQSLVPVIDGSTVIRIPVVTTSHLRIRVKGYPGHTVSICELGVYSGNAGNLALTATLTSSSNYVEAGRDWGLDNLVDGISDTRWNAAANDPDQWVAFQWDQEQIVRMVRFRQAFDRIKTYEIQTSCDGKTWANVGNPLVPLPAQPEPGTTTFAAQQFSTRYLRIHIQDMSPDGLADGCSIYDVEIRNDLLADNKASYATASASGTSAGSSPVLVADGHFDTWWISQPADTGGSSSGAWLRLTWPFTESFTRVAWDGHGIETYRLETSQSDASDDWMPITADLPVVGSTKDVSFSSPVQARALQLYVVSATPEGRAEGVGIAEMRVFGEDAYNKALAAETVGSSTFTDDPAYDGVKATDGRFETRWNAAPGGAGGSGAWLRLGWTEPMTFMKVRWSQCLTERIARYRMETSSTAEDGSWSAVTDDLDAAPSGNEVAFSQPVTARYLRLFVIEATTDGNQNGVSIEEISVTNEETETFDPANRALISKTTAKNFLDNDPASVPGKATDGDATTRWNAAAGGPGGDGCWIALNWDDAETIGKVSFSQVGNRIHAYRLESSDTGAEGTYAAVTGTIVARAGTNTVLPSTSVQTKHLRLYVLRADAEGNSFGVSITELSAYNTINLTTSLSLLGAARSLTDGSYVQVLDPLVAEGVPGRLYVQSPDRSSGIGCDHTGADIPAGTLVNVRGMVATVSGEKVLLHPEIMVWGLGPEPRPLGLSATWWLASNEGAAPDGLLCTVWGSVISLDPLTIDNGSGVPIVIDAQGSLPMTSVGDFVSVTGALGRESDGVTPVVRMRALDDWIVRR